VFMRVTLRVTSDCRAYGATPVAPYSIRNAGAQPRRLVAMLLEREVSRRPSSDIPPEASHVARW